MGSEKEKSLSEDQCLVHTVAQLKGRRLRMVRALTGFSRQELYEKIGIATSTIDTWESGRVELTEKSAIRICDALRKVGIYCIHEWLLTGAGSPPRMMGEVEKSIFSPMDMNISDECKIKKDFLFKIPPFLDEDVRLELSFFFNLHKNAMFYILEEDFMRYKRSDCVAGEEEDLKNLEGKVVIMQLEDGKTILCKLLSVLGEESKVFYNKSNKSVKTSKAAEIIWHRMSKRRKK